MSRHPSLKVSKAGKKNRTVLKRYEKVIELKKKGLFSDDSSVYKMPKVKIKKTKIKKEVKEKAKEGEETKEAAK